MPLFTLCRIRGHRWRPVRTAEDGARDGRVCGACGRAEVYLEPLARWVEAYFLPLPAERAGACPAPRPRRAGGERRSWFR